jgi:hypothetical protein
MDFPIGNDFVNQKTHPKSEKVGDEVFQDESNNRDHIQKGAKTVTLDKGDHGGEHHTEEEKGPCQKDHEKIDSFPAKDASTLFDLKNDVQRYPQGAEYPCGGPHQPPDTQYTNNFPVPYDSQDVVHNPRVEGGKGILQITSYMV